MIKVVLFDFGGVLTEGGKLGSIRGMFARGYGVQPKDVVLDSSVEDAFRGTITDEAFVAAINALNPAYPPVTTYIFIDNADIFSRCDPVYAIAARLRAAGIITGIFSNVFAISAAVLQREGYYDGFAPLFLSCQLQRMKPEQPLYTQVIQKLGVQANEVLFIDDRDDFLIPARALGMHTVQAVSPKQIVQDTTGLLMAENNITL
jgi:putative hydrolase of the HAD superfamily